MFCVNNAQILNSLLPPPKKLQETLFDRVEVAAAGGQKCYDDVDRLTSKRMGTGR